MIDVVASIAAILLGIGEAYAVWRWGLRGTMRRLKDWLRSASRRLVEGPPEVEVRRSYIHGLADDLSVSVEDLVLAAEREVDGTYDRPRPTPAPTMNLDGPRAPIILMDNSVSWTTGGGEKPITVMTSVTLHGGRADGQRIVLSRTPERIAVGDQWYEQIKDPDTGRFLGGYARSVLNCACSYCGQPPHAYEGTHLYQQRIEADHE